MIYNFQNSNKIDDLHRLIVFKRLALLKYFFFFLNHLCTSLYIVTFLMCQSKLAKLTSLHIRNPPK